MKRFEPGEPQAYGDRARTMDRRTCEGDRRQNRSRRLSYPGQGRQGRGPGCACKIGLTTCGYAQGDHHRVDGSPMDHEYLAEEQDA